MPSGLFDRLDITEERISELEGMTIETLKAEKWKEEKSKQNIQRLWDNNKIYVHNENTRRERKKQSNIWSNNCWELTQISFRYHTTDPEISEKLGRINAKPNKNKKQNPPNPPIYKSIPKSFIFKC